MRNRETARPSEVPNNGGIPPSFGDCVEGSPPRRISIRSLLRRGSAHRMSVKGLPTVRSDLVPGPDVPQRESEPPNNTSDVVHPVTDLKAGIPASIGRIDDIAQAYEAAVKEDNLREKVNVAASKPDIVDFSNNNTNADQTLDEARRIAEAFAGKPDTTLVHISTDSVFGDGHDAYMDFLCRPEWNEEAVDIDLTFSDGNVRVDTPEEYDLLLDIAAQKVVGQSKIDEETKAKIADIKAHELQHGSVAEEEGLKVQYGVTFQKIRATGALTFCPATVASGTTTIAGYRKIQGAADQPSQGDLTALGHNTHTHSH